MDAGEAERGRLVKIALGVMTDMMGRGPDERLSFEGSELERVVVDDGATEVEIVAGLMNLALILLIKLEAHGDDIDEVLADIGRRF